MTGSTGCLYVHACPASLRAAAESVIASALPGLHVLPWSPEAAGLAVTTDWAGRQGSAAAITEGLRTLGALTFEITEDAAPGCDGERFSFVPGLGLFRAATNSAGDVVVDENQLSAAVRDSPNAEALRERLARLIGRPWDDVLEPLRMRAWAPTHAAATG